MHRINSSPKTLLLFIFIASSSLAFAQFKGGAGQGVSFNLYTGSNLGLNIFKGGTEDGFVINNALGQNIGVNIFKGATDDGMVTTITLAQNIGSNIFKGAADDGFSSVAITAQNIGSNIFKGSADDGFAIGSANGQSLGRSFFSGGDNDGWVMAIAGVNAPLPVTLVTFTAAWQGEDVLTKWITSSEMNTDHFEIERSVDGSLFTMVGQTAAVGNSSVTQAYSFPDIKVNARFSSPPSKLYYRLKTVDKDGHTAFSAIVVLSNQRGAALYTLYPNPAKSQFVIESTNRQSNYLVSLVSSANQTVLQKTVTSPREVIDVATLANGIYFVEITDINKKTTQTFKILIQH